MRAPSSRFSIGNCLDILEKLYIRVSVPEAVIKEVIDCGEGRVGTDEVANARFIDREQLDEAPDPLLSGALGAGEAEVIALGYQRKASLVILDDRRARRIASQAYGLRVKGTAGIIVAAKRNGLVTEIRPLLETMASNGYFLSSRLVERACIEAGEQ
ncbi:MAG: DUF3368 domain-containing protein [Proteobacteria bacterium]|nr:DUF3368 domain-containing protein [Pseudomonadota bacterium]